MNYNRPLKSGSTFTIRVMCATVFVVFSFCWLYFFQSDVFMMAQHVLSGGVTHYNRMVGAVLITITLSLVQMLVFRFVHLEKRSHALTYLPSMLLLAMLSTVYPSGQTGVTFSFSWWTPILVLLVWLPVVRMSRMAQDVEEDDNYHLLSRPMWINMLLMAFMMAGVAWIGNTNAVFHYRMRAERCLLERNAAKALEIGNESLESDADLLMLRMYALARQGALGESLFEYPITGTNEQILPTDSQTVMMLYPVDSLYKYIGARPAGRMSPIRYLELMQRRDTLPNKAVNDYLLCSYLIDKDLDTFAAEIGKYYTVNDSLPKHYREALTLYTHSKVNPVVVYRQPVMEEDYRNYLAMKKQYSLPSERKGKVKEYYWNTYWYYYDFEE